MTKSLRVLIAATLTSLLGLATPLTAHPQEKKDKNDVAGALDLEAVSIWHEDDQIAMSALMYGTLDLASLTPPNGIFFNIDKNRDGKWDRAIYVSYEEFQLQGVLYKNKKGEPEEVGPVNAGTIYEVIQIFIEKSALGIKGNKRIKWKVATSFQNSGDCAGTCTDLAPNKGWYKHKI